MTVTYQHTRDELKALQLSERPKLPTWPSTFYYYGVLPGVFLIVALGSSFGLATVVMLLVFLGGAFANLQHERLARQASSPDAFAAHRLEPTTVKIDSDGMHYHHRLFEGLSRWQLFSDIREVGGYLRFQNGANESFHIPIRAFTSEEEARRFLELAKQCHSDAEQTDATQK